MTSPLYREARKFYHINAAGDEALRATGESAWLHRIVINTGAAGTIGIYNKGDAEGTADVAVITVAAGDEGSIEYDVRLDNGLSLDVSATMDITVIYE
jgi:hypothetical protein